jgi:site-specific recombinase XerD
VSDDRRSDPEELTVPDAVKRYLRRMRRDKADSTVQTYRLDLRQFVQWCEAEEIERVSELSGLDLELFQDDRAADLEPASLENQMGLLKRFIKFCEDIGAAPDGLHDTVHVPRASVQEQSSDEKLSTEDATDLLLYFRDESNGLFGSKWHALLEVVWHTGARVGGIRTLDIDDYDSELCVLEFRHRPAQGTPLKNKLDGERDVAILPEVAAALDQYIKEHRHHRHDEAGRAPLFTTRSEQGRLSTTAVRLWMYQATHPCWHTDEPCPHNKHRETCSWTSSAAASKCPSARSPHAVRTGAITFHRDRGFDPKDTSERVNASLRTIEKHYDKAERRAKMENRRRPQLDKLSLDNDSSHD